MKSAYCGGDSRDSGTCNVLPVKLFEQSESTSKLQGTCKGRDFENFELCKAIKAIIAWPIPTLVLLSAHHAAQVTIPGSINGTCSKTVIGTK